MAFDARSRKKKMVLVLVIFLASFTLSLLQRTKRDQGKFQQTARCKELRALLQTKNLSDRLLLIWVATEDRFKALGESGSSRRQKPAENSSSHFYMTASDKVQALQIESWKLPTKDKRILENLLLSQGCHWEPDAMVMAKYREELRQCCNASFWLVATKENSPLGSHILLDGDKGKKLPVKENMWDLLPERSPFSEAQYKYCAVVGNGGILRGSHCGEEIDRADLIVRFNLPPMNYSEDVGTKTHLVTVNPSILQNKFNQLLARRKPFADALRPYGDALFLIPSLSFMGHSDVGYRAIYTMEDFGLMQQAFFMNPRYLDSLSNYWKKRTFRPRRLSSGFMLVNMALEFCQRITLYGFWPFPCDLERRAIPHHYYDNTWPKPGVHAMPEEFSNYLDMYARGVLQLRLGKCT